MPAHTNPTKPFWQSKAVWLNVAATNGSKKATQYRDKVLERFNVSERKLELELSKLCFKKPASCPKYSDD